MSVRMGLLTLLRTAPSYGYQLRSDFDARTGGTWPVNTGQVYMTLDRLERDGLVHRDAADDDGRVLYSISDAGAGVVDSWIAAPVAQQAGRDDLAMKLALVATMPGFDVARVIQAQRSAAMHSLQELTRTKPAQHTPASVTDLSWALVVESMIFAAEAQMRWLDYAEALLDEALPAADATQPGTSLPLRIAPRADTSSRRSDVQR